MLRKVALVSIAILPAISAHAGERILTVHTDAAGTLRVLTDQAGNVVERHDYLPFGEEWCQVQICASVAAGQTKRFTGKERDFETGLDYFGARYMRANLGRFTSVDPGQKTAETLLDPQRWNRYGYGLNNPFRYV